MLSLVTSLKLSSLFVILLLIVACSNAQTDGQSEASGATEAAREWLIAVTTMDALRADELVCLSEREEFRRAMGAGGLFLTFIGGDLTIELDTDDLRFEVIENTSSSALVSVQGEMRAAIGTQVASQYFDDTWRMTREFDEWQWCGDIAALVEDEVNEPSLEPPTPVLPTEPSLPSATANSGESEVIDVVENTSVTAPTNDGHSYFLLQDYPSLLIMPDTESTPQHFRLLDSINASGGIEDRVAWSPDGEWIVFAEQDNEENVRGNTDLYIMRPDGSESRQLTDMPGVEYQPSWSPDGKMITFTHVMFSQEGEVNNIYVVPTAGGTVQQLTNTGKDNTATWSPDGQQLAFITSRSIGADEHSQLAELYIMNADGSDQRIIPDGAGKTNVMDHGSVPKWSPSGRYLLYDFWVYGETSDLTETRILDMETGTSGLIVLGSSPIKSFPRGVEWSPIEDLLLFQTYPRDGDQSYITGPYGENSVTVPGGDHRYLNTLMWSPTGEEILMMIATDNTSGIYDFFILTLETGQREQVATIKGVSILGWIP